jgi:hypothetical protein
MKLSTDRILTTHVDSVSRELAVLDLLYKKENGDRYDADELDATAAAAVSEVVHKQAASIVGRERVIAGTDCGFGSFAGLGRVEPGIAYKKLGALVEGAARASRQLWGRTPPRSGTGA